MSVHRKWYPNVRGGQDPASVKHLIEADPVVYPEGVALKFTEPDRRYSPDELRMLARWLYSLSHEAEGAAAAGHIGEESGYDVERCAKVRLR